MVFDDTCVDTCAALADGTAHDEIPTVNTGVVLVPGCDTAIVLVTAGEPDVVMNVTIADRDKVVVFAAADTVTVPLLDPDAGDIVTHAWFDDTDHVVFDDTLADICAALADGTDHAVVSTVNTGAGLTPGCVTVTVFVVTGPAWVVVNVNVAERVAPELYAANTYTEVSPVPEVGDVVNHVVFDDVTAHVPVAFSCMYAPVPAFVGTSHTSLSILRKGIPGWRTVTVFVTTGEPVVVVNVTIAVRAAVDGFSVAFNRTMPAVGLFTLLTANQDWSEENVQLAFDVTWTVVSAVDADARSQVAGLTDNVAATPG